MIRNILLVLIGALIIGACVAPPAQQEGDVGNLVITESSNVTLEGMQSGQAIPLPMEAIGGTIGDGLKQEFANRNSSPVITTEDYLKGNPGAMIITLDGNATNDILSPSILSMLAGTAGSIIPGAQPWAGLALMLIPLLSGRFRRHAGNAVRRVVPGVPGPNNDGVMPDFTDLREAVIDVGKAVTLAPIESPQVIVESPQKTQTQING